jgi:hypothetical protein
MNITKRPWAAVILVMSLGVMAQMAGSAQRASANPLFGVWRVSEITYTGPNAKKVSSPQPGIFIVTGRYYSMQAVISDTPRREIPSHNATLPQYGMAFKNFAADSGTYDVTGNELTFKPVVAKTPAVLDYSVVDTFELEGTDTMWLTQKSDQGGLVANPVTIKLLRVE